MSDLHQLRAEPSSKNSVESVSSDFQTQKLLWARDQSWKVFGEIRSALREGMTESEAFQLSRSVFSDFGVSKHWHKPYVRFGPGTVLTFDHPLQPDYKLQLNDPVYIDLGPAWLDEESDCLYEGDVGDSFVFGENKIAQECAESAREIFCAVESEWKAENLSGADLYGRVKKKVESRGYRLTESVQGHRISDFPHHQYSKEKLGNLNFKPSKLLWVLEVHIRRHDDDIGAFFEDILGVVRS